MDEKVSMPIKKTEQRFIELIFIDEFSLSPRSNKQYGWSLIRSKGFVKEPPNSKSISRIVALSQNRYYDTLIVKGTINTKYFRSFLDSLYKSMKEQGDEKHKAQAVTWDNWSSHKAKLVTQYLEKNREAIITISPYLLFFIIA